MPRGHTNTPDKQIPLTPAAPTKKVAWGKRLLTAGIAIPSIFLLIWLPWPSFHLAVAATTALGYYEFSMLAEIHDKRILLPTYALMTLLVTSYRDYVIVAAPYLLSLLPLLLRGPADGFRIAILNMFYLYTFAYPISFGALMRLELGEYAPYMTLLWVLISFASDAGALILGSRIGKHLLCPHVSPGKTWEGLLGAVIAGVGSGIFFGLLNFVPGLGIQDYIILGLSEALVGMVGDLVESGFKRFTSSKDSGNLLPGHGGFLDRLDALAATAPVAYYIFRARG